jgi:hypothetical protein
MWPTSTGPTSNGSVADVDGAGSVVGVGLGTATITATSEGVEGSANVSVVTQVITTADVTPVSATLRAGGSRQFAVVARDQFGLVTNATFVWSASGGSITNQGLYTAGSLVGTYEVVATETSGVADTAAVTIQEQSAAYPNEPAGLVQLGEHTFPAGYFGDDAHFGAAASYTAPGARWHMRDLSKALHIETGIADAPMSPPGTMGMAYPTGMLSSGEPASFGFYIPEQRELYVSYHFMMPSNPASGKWELEPAGVKILGYISYGDDNQQNQGFPLFKPGGLQAGPLSARSDYAGKPDACADYVDEPNRYKITLDEWHQFEFYGKLNDMGQANGVLRIWLDGELYSECDQMSYISSSWPHGFWQIHFQPVWGGWHEGLRKTQDDYAYLDHIYVSGVNK